MSRKHEKPNEVCIYRAVRLNKLARSSSLVQPLPSWGRFLAISQLESLATHNLRGDEDGTGGQCTAPFFELQCKIANLQWLHREAQILRRYIEGPANFH